MRGSIWFMGLLAACGVGIAAFAAWAQVIDSDPCERACYEQKSICVTACGENVDPVECEGTCEDQVEDCLSECN